MTVYDAHTTLQFAMAVMLAMLALVMADRARQTLRGAFTSPSAVMLGLMAVFLAAWAVRQWYWMVYYIMVTAKPAQAQWLLEWPLVPLICNIIALAAGAAMIVLYAQPMLGQRAPLVVSGGVLAVVVIGAFLAG